MTGSTLDEALRRLRDTGPERTGRLSNHAPMAVEMWQPDGDPALPATANQATAQLRAG